ncbi:hypothetical protein MMON44395_24240 [Mycolicibacterium monacense DSM 44395]|nr:hypothetical protein [Mycolicibacterium monacense DSM 44395]
MTINANATALSELVAAVLPKADSHGIRTRR